MELKKYLDKLSREDKSSFAEKCGTSLAFLRNVAYGYKRAGESLCINIERESGGAVTCEELRPDVDWAYLRSSAPKAEAAGIVIHETIHESSGKVVTIDSTNRREDELRHGERRNGDRRNNSNGGGRRSGERRVNERRVVDRRE